MVATRMAVELFSEILSRPSNNAVVYFVAREDFDDGPFAVHAGILLKPSSTPLHSLSAAEVQPWDLVEQQPAADPAVSCPMHSVFTAEEVRDIVRADGGPLTLDHRPLGALVLDRATNFQLTTLLSTTALRYQLQYLPFGPNSFDS